MDNFINLAKQGYEAYESSQQGKPGAQGHAQGAQGGGYSQPNAGGYGQSNQGGYEGNQGEYGHNQPSGGGGYGSHSGPEIDHDAVIQNANQQAGGSGDSSMFGNAMGFIKQNQSQHTQPIDEENVQSAHAEAYQKGNASSLDATSLGSAAAMQILKQFTSGGGPSGGTGNSQSQLISLAMAEASKLFDTQGSSSGQKQDAINGAAMTIMKLLVQSKMGGASTTGAGNSGGLSGLMGLASQFMK
ncbi:hypothetical protein FRC12_012942 [Ceratobasidium sp. 428]|nr:hypothetical protein FRC09_002262 [Ceratobasidium sp. 395]KAG8750315.1 hypothetical protein FRC12_012942 [Ceratobasidium sp. 428]